MKLTAKPLTSEHAVDFDRMIEPLVSDLAQLTATGVEGPSGVRFVPTTQLTVGDIAAQDGPRRYGTRMTTRANLRNCAQ